MSIQPKPQRRTQRVTHLDASVVHYERALLARAEAMDSTVTLTEEGIDPAAEAVRAVLAREFRNLAEELHWW